jgi:plasmid stability protein
MCYTGASEVANLTLSLDDDLLKRARIRALERDTSVNALVRGYLEDFAATGPQPSAMAGFLTLTESVHAGSGPRGRSWTREQLYERRE